MNDTVWQVTLLNSIYPPIFLMIGVIGNIMSMLIWIKRVTSCPGSTCLFLSVLCVTDTYVLIHGCMRQWLRGLIPHFDIRVILNCKYPLLIFTLFSDFSVWLIVLLCIERCICVFLPINAKQICQIRNGGLALLVTFVTLLAINVHFIWTVEVAGTRDHCTTTNITDPRFHVAWSYIDLAIYSLIPMIFIFAMNSTILYKLHRTHSRLNRAKHSATGRIFWTVFLMAVAHFAFTMPITIYFLIPDAHCAQAEVICEISLNFFIMLQQANHLMHFFLYAITSTLFACDLKAMLPWLRKLDFETQKVNIGGTVSKAIIDEFEYKSKLEEKSLMKPFHSVGETNHLGIDMPRSTMRYTSF